jgi:hypothetical protein
MNTATPVKCICGRTHRNGGVWFTQSGQSHGCRYAAVIEAERELHSAAGIARQAAIAREDGERHFGKVLRSDGTISEWRLQEARAAYAKAYELEN